MPIIALFAGAVFGQSSLIAVSAFVIGIAAVVCSGIILKKFKAFAGEPAPFVMELPAYHMPTHAQYFLIDLGAGLVLHQAGRYA